MNVSSFPATDEWSWMERVSVDDWEFDKMDGLISEMRREREAVGALSEMLACDNRDSSATTGAVHECAGLNTPSSSMDACDDARASDREGYSVGSSSAVVSHDEDDEDDAFEVCGMDDCSETSVSEASTKFYGDAELSYASYPHSPRSHTSSPAPYSLSPSKWSALVAFAAGGEEEHGEFAAPPRRLSASCHRIDASSPEVSRVTMIRAEEASRQQGCLRQGGGARRRHSMLSARDSSISLFKSTLGGNVLLAVISASSTAHASPSYSDADGWRRSSALLRPYSSPIYSSWQRLGRALSHLLGNTLAAPIVSTFECVDASNFSADSDLTKYGRHKSFSRDNVVLIRFSIDLDVFGHRTDFIHRLGGSLIDCDNLPAQ